MCIWGSKKIALCWQGLHGTATKAPHRCHRPHLNHLHQGHHRHHESHDVPPAWPWAADRSQETWPPLSLAVQSCFCELVRLLLASASLISHSLAAPQTLLLFGLWNPWSPSPAVGHSCSSSLTEPFWLSLFCCASQQACCKPPGPGSHWRIRRTPSGKQPGT